MWQKLIWMAGAGAAGTLARFGLASLIYRLHGAEGFPWGTLAVNALGCLFFGLVWAKAGGRDGISDEIRLIVLIGFMGAFTTFSTFAFETVELMRDSKWLFVAGNVIGQNLLGLGFVYTGTALAKII